MTPDNRNSSMRAVRIHEFGGIDRLTLERVPRPSPAAGEVLVRVKAAGVGPWDAWIREGKSKLGQTPPLTLGSDLSGIVENVGDGVSAFRPGDEVYGVTNPQFLGAYGEYAIAHASMIAKKPARISHIEAASVPVIAVTASQMLFEHASAGPGKRVLVLGGAGNVGAYAVQLAKRSGAKVTATARAKDVEFVRSLGADEVLEDAPAEKVDIVIDTVGGDALVRSFDSVVRSGVVVSAVEQPDAKKAAEHGVRGDYFIVEVRTKGLTSLAELIDEGALVTSVGDVLSLGQVPLAHEMLAGKAHKRGKIVIDLAL